MHTFKWPNNGSPVFFHYNSDMSGDVVIHRASAPKMSVEGKAILAFVAEHVRRCRIAVLEAATDYEILGIE